jgi:hypothetical protein
MALCRWAASRGKELRKAERESTQSTITGDALSFLPGAVHPEDSSPDVREYLATYLQHNMNVAVIYTPTEQQKNDPAYADLVQPFVGNVLEDRNLDGPVSSPTSASIKDQPSVSQPASLPPTKTSRLAHLFNPQQWIKTMYQLSPRSNSLPSTQSKRSSDTKMDYTSNCLCFSGLFQRQVCPHDVTLDVTHFF